MPIRFDDALHKAGEETPIRSFALMDALAWWIASEFVRRHPGELYIHHTGSEFQYDVLAVTRRKTADASGRSRAVVWMNRQPGGHLTTGTWFDDSSSTERFNWLEILASPNRFDYVVKQIEAEARLRSPASTPATVASTVGPRVIAGFLARTVLTRKKWMMIGGLDDSGMGDAWAYEGSFKHFSGMAKLIPKPVGGAYTDSDYRYWFLCPATPGEQEEAPDRGNPTHAFDTDNGLLWTPNESNPINLFDVYNSVGRSMDALISAVCPPAY